jgi:hypothetical protein
MRFPLPARCWQPKRWVGRAFLSCLVFVLLTFLLRASGRMPLLVTLVPRAQMESGSYQFPLVSETTDPRQQQVPLRTLTSRSLPQVALLSFSGSLPAHHATGELTFINNTAQPITIFPRMLVGTSRIPVTFSGPLTIPANDPPDVITTGVAMLPGAVGEIPAFDIDQICCHAGVMVKNTTAFSLTPPTSAKQLTALIGTMKQTLQHDTQISLEWQVARNERVLPGSVTCHATTTMIPANTATRLTVAVTCSERVYDDARAQMMAAHLLLVQARRDPHLAGSYAPAGSFQFRETFTTPAGHAQLGVQVWRPWVAHFTQARLASLAQMIAGKQESQARALLLRQPDITTVVFAGEPGAAPGEEDLLIVVASPPLPCAEGDH